VSFRSNAATRCISVGAKALDRGRLCFASGAHCGKVASSSPSISASVSKINSSNWEAVTDFLRFNFGRRVNPCGRQPFARKWRRQRHGETTRGRCTQQFLGLSCRLSLVKSGFEVDGPAKAPLPSFRFPLPTARLPFHSASAVRVGIDFLAV